jgi:hypothetical protein
MTDQEESHQMLLLRSHSVAQNSLFIFIYYLLVLLEFELRASLLLGKCSTTWPMTSALFALVIFQIGSCIFIQDVLRLKSSDL